MIRSYRFEAAYLDPSRREALAYLRIPTANGETGALLTSAIREAKQLADCRCRVGVFDIAFAPAIHPAISEKMPKNATRFGVFCATVGHELDRRIARYAHSDPARAALLDAAAGALTEAVCDKLTATLAAELAPARLCPRFSPGYGSIPLEAQARIFDILELSRMGVGLNDSLLLSPAKTVTAIIPIID